MVNKSVMESLGISEMQDVPGVAITSCLFIHCSVLCMWQFQVLYFANIWTFLTKYFQSAVGSIHRYGNHAYRESIL